MSKWTGLALIIAVAMAGSACQQAPAATPAGGGGGAPQARASDADREFIDGMVPHHQMAIMMANAALAMARRDELRAFARQVIDDQQREIDQMKGWRAAWLGSADTPPPAMGQMPGWMAGGMMGSGIGGSAGGGMMGPGMGGSAMGGMVGPGPSGPETFDVRWAEQMIVHHEGAITMAERALGSQIRDEVRSLARRIVDAQRAEQAQLRGWVAAWSAE